MSNPLQGQFQSHAPLAAVRHQQLSADIPAGLGINRAYLKWAENWDGILCVSPRTVYETLCRDIAGDVKMFIDLDMSGEGDFTLSVRDHKRLVFDIENQITRDIYGTTLKFKNWENKDADSRGRGMGLKLFRNFISLAESGRIDFIKLRAGKEDGRYFWARHGFHCADIHDVSRVSVEIRENIKKYSDTLPAGINDLAQKIVDQGGLDMCWRLARLPGQVAFSERGDTRLKPLGWALLRTDSECNYSLNIHDPVQMAQVRSSLERGAATLGSPNFRPA